MAKKAIAKRAVKRPPYKIPARDYAIYSGKSLRIQSIEFKRTPMADWEKGLLVNETEQSPVIDMDGRVVIQPVYNWRPTFDLTFVYHDKGE